MFEFIDRVPASGKANRKKITHSDGSVEYVTIENADNANPIGTPLNKTTFEAMQKAIIPIIGVYIGDGQNSRIINLGFTPDAVLVMRDGYSMEHNQGGLAIKEHSVSSVLEIVENGFKVACIATGNTVSSNVANGVYHYVAFKGVINKWL